MSLLNVFTFLAHLRPQQVFLLDGIGAGVSLVMTMAILWLQPWFGMPVAIMHLLLPLIAVFAVNSLLCWLFAPRRWRLLLGLIAAANVAYAVVILALLVLQRETLTLLGLACFAGEALVLIGLGVMEMRLVRRR